MATAKSRRPKRRERRAAAREAAKARAGAARAANATPGAPGDGPPAHTAPRHGDGGEPGPSDPPAQTAPRHGDGGASGPLGPFGPFGPLGPSGLSGLLAPLAAISRRDLAAVIGLALLVAVSYFPALSGGFVWDDTAFAEEPLVHRWSGLWDIWLSPGDISNEGHYWPLVYTTFWLEHKLWGLAPFGYHLVNLLLHLLNCVLVWRLLLKLAVPGAWAVAAVFAVHPLHVESVAWIIERKDLLSTAFYLGAVLVWVRFTETPTRGRYALALGLFVAGLLSKSMVVTLPAALVVWHWWKRGVVTATDWLRLAPFFAVGLAITLADLAFYTAREPLALGWSGLERVLIAARALWFYAGKLLWPADLVVIYPHWEVHAGDVVGWVAVAGAVALAGVLWAARHRLGRGPVAGVAFFAVTLSPVLGFVDYGYMQFSFVADRFQYLAGLGVLAVVVGGAVHGARRLAGGLGGRGADAAPPGGAAHGAGRLAGGLGGRGADAARPGGAAHGAGRLPSGLGGRGADAAPPGGAVHGAGRLAGGLGGRGADAARPGGAAHGAGRLAGGLDGQGADAARPGGAAHGAGRLAEGLGGQGADAAPPGGAAHGAGRLAGGLDGRSADAARPGGAAQGAGRLPGRLPGGVRIGAGGAFVVVLVVLGALTWRQAGIYRDEITFFSHIVARNPEARDAHLNLGNALFKANRVEESHAASLVAVEQRPDSDKAHVNLGNALLHLERFDEAETHLSRALEINPRNRVAQQNMGALRHKQGRDEEAIEWYRKVLAHDAANALAHAGLGISRFELERHEEAVESMERALALALAPEPAPDSIRALPRLLGRALQALGRFDAAERHLLRAARIDPADPMPLVDLARLRVAQQRPGEADAYLRRARELAPDDPAALQNVAETQRKQGRYEEAIESYRAVLALDPEFAMAHAGMGDALLRLQRHEEAVESLARSISLQPHPPPALLVLAGNASQALGRTEAAARYYRRALERDPLDAAARESMGALRLEQGRHEEAIEWFRKVLAGDPANALAHGRLGASLFALNRHREAVESLERAIALGPESSNLGALHGLTGRALRALGRLDAAERHFLRAARIDPRNPTPLVDLGRLHMARQRLDEADAYLRRARELAPGNPAVLHSVAEAQRQQGRHEEAIESYRAVLALDPGFAAAHAGLGVALSALGRPEEARESFERALSLDPNLETARSHLERLRRSPRARTR